MTIPTVDSLRRAHRRLDRRNAAKQRREHTAADLLQAMKRGVSLHRCNRNHRVLWALSTGEIVTAEAADDLLRNPHVVGVGDALFADAPSQTFRWIEE
jgi:uncharacterized protein YuzB (UPF0349 family)